MMLSTDDTLESPTSTLCFPGTTSTTTTLLPVPNNNIGVLFNENNNNNNNNMIPLTAPMDGGGFVNDDDIMAAVEAFRATAAYDNNNNNNSIVSHALTNGVVLEGLNNDESALVYDSNENLETEEENMAIINGDGSLCSVNLEENNKHYWNNIFNLMNDSVF